MDQKLISCSYRDFGCPVKLTKDLLKKHCKEDAASHLNLVTKALNAERADKDFHREASQCATRRCENVDRENLTLRQQHHALQLLEQIITGDLYTSKLSDEFVKQRLPKKKNKNDDFNDAASKLKILLREHGELKSKLDDLQKELAEKYCAEGELVDPYLSDPNSMARSGFFGYTGMGSKKFLTPSERMMLSTKPLCLSPRSPDPKPAVPLTKVLNFRKYLAEKTDQLCPHARSKSTTNTTTN
mmetsp:Transcript_11495/g.21068  ORF Transcript_11495/g.21068 Transcript_11495/m.21068 type:complete len:243 (-) Transcript_11495:199-927(-)|eukprot:CAMPEP_0197515206 /NCGR_PEP_ID=MMETSP1318-20131121/408_1 /TAXON_ID=552666 /ORGANISM="Partenskyella glossopodia, Strain RCC365" /LENGTH=242 /DNA_ID=CAMNT_0043063513 /DNA_START=111 /DNA_END=839 /DNA_ORIENTATION=-